MKLYSPLVSVSLSQAQPLVYHAPLGHTASKMYLPLALLSVSPSQTQPLVAMCLRMVTRVSVQFAWGSMKMILLMGSFGMNGFAVPTFQVVVYGCTVIASTVARTTVLCATYAMLLSIEHMVQIHPFGTHLLFQFSLEIS